MGQATVKATRRALRRAVGPDALNTIRDQDQAIGILQAAVSGLQREVATLAVNHAEFKRATALAVTGLVGFRERPFLGRLRWLVTGQ